VIILTAAHIEQLRTPQGGFNQATMEIVGCWPLHEGWKDRLVGMKIGDRRWKAALKAKDRRRHFFRGNTRRP
jgi:hypothetical protein